MHNALTFIIDFKFNDIKGFTIAIQRLNLDA